MDAGDYQKLLRDDCVDMAHRLGSPVDLFDAANDAQTQVRQLESCLAQPPNRRPSLILVSPVNEASLYVTAVSAARLGVAWVMLLRWADYLNDLHQQFASVPIFAVMVDQQEVGRIQGRQFRALLPGGGDVVYIRGALGTSSAHGRFAGLQEVLKGSSIDLYILDSDFTVAGGRRAIEGQTQIFQSTGRARFILGAQNDAMAMGARGALEEVARTSPSRSLDRVAFCGCDGAPGYGQRLVREGKLTATVIMPPGAGQAVEAVAAHRMGRPRPPVLHKLSPTGYPEPHRLAPLGAR
jgi:ABC-type sugar transport system substrate-binding protein